MNIKRAGAKLYTTHCQLTDEDFIFIFHQWIQQNRLDELVIDVVDYGHVHQGPGVMLVTDTAYYALERSDGRLGLSFRQRRGAAEGAAAAWRHALSAALTACQHLEEDFSDQLAFSGSEIALACHDRLRAPNDEATFTALQGDLEVVCAEAFPDGGWALRQLGDHQSCFRAHLQHPETLNVTAMAERLLE